MLVFISISTAHAYDVPELIYYQFDTAGSTVSNHASSPVGTNPAQINNQTVGSVGQFLTGLVGAGGSSNSNYVNTGWLTNLPSSGWTISLWVNGLVDNGNLSYLFGEAGSSFRCFKGGAAGSGNLRLRGNNYTDVTVIGILSSQPAVVTFVYDPSGPNIKAYVNGALNNTVAQQSVTLSGSTLKVGGYDTANALESSAIIDEFRLYSRALSAAEVAATWNVNLYSSPAPTAQAIPTLSEWTQLMLGLMVMMMIVWQWRKKQS
jgi:hypothetical protein